MISIFIRKIRAFLHPIRFYVEQYIERPIIMRWLQIRYPLKILDSLSTLDLIAKEKLSVARFGDGEFSIIWGGNIGFQSFDKELQQRLKEVLILNQEGLLICIPYTLAKLKDIKPKAAKVWRTLCVLEKLQKRLAKMGLLTHLFGDALFTRPYIDWTAKHPTSLIFHSIINLWNKRAILVVEGAGSRLGVGNDLFVNATSIRRIICPSKNAFSVYSLIHQSVLEFHQNGELVLIALGPTATILAADLATSSIQAIDIGHIDIEYEWFKNGALYKQDIPGKAVNECASNEVAFNCDDKEYLEQIILKIESRI